MNYPDQVLSAWGISPEVAKRHNLKWNGKDSFVYPSGTKMRNRILFAKARPDGTKNIWDTQTEYLGKPPLFNIAALAAPGDEVHIANGEKSTMAVETAGFECVVNTFGEGNEVEAAIEYLLVYGKKVVHVYPDCDTHGLQAAEKWLRLGTAAGLDVRLYDLRLYLEQSHCLHPEQYQIITTKNGHKYTKKGWDQRDIWLLLNQDQAAFHLAMENLPPLDFERYRDELPIKEEKAPTEPRPRKQYKSRPGSVNWGEEYERWQNEVIDAFHSRSSGRKGKHYSCVNPRHDDQHPSARITSDGWYICTCGSYSLDVVAEWVGPTVWADRKAMLIEDWHQANPGFRKPEIEENIDTSAPMVADGEYRRVDMAYLNVRELPLGPGVYAIKSGIGTNKTGFAIETIRPYLENNLGALWLVHRRTLSSNTSERLSKEHNLVMEDYQNVEPYYRPLLTKIVLSINGLVTLEKIPNYEAVVIDEVEQLLSAILSKELFKGAEGVNALIRLEHVVRSAKIVICLDAHAGSITFSWLKSIREDVTFIENTHQRPKKPLHRFESEAALLTHADKTIAEGDGTVLIGCASATTAKSIRQRYLDKGLLKENEVRCITQETSGVENREFIRNINSELPKYRLLIYSPSMGTGVDVKGLLEDNKTQYIKAVYCLFSKRDRDFTVPDMLQMLGRARNADNYYFELTTLPALPEQRRSTSVLKIYDMEYQRVLSSRKLIEQVINDQGLPDITDAQKKLLKLYAKVRAAKNYSLNDLPGHFEKLAADQYEIQLAEAQDPGKAIKKEMKAARAAIKAERRHLLLTVPELHPKEYQRKSIEGLTEADLAGYEKFLIHDTYGQEVDEEILEHDNGGQGRAQLLAFCSITAKESEIAQLDLASVTEGHALHLIKDLLAQRRLIIEAIRAVWGKETADVGETNIRAITKEDIERGMERYLEENRQLLKYHFKWRASYSDDPLDALRRIMRRAGLEVELIRNQSKEGMYRVSKTPLETMMKYRLSRLEHLKRKAVEREHSTRFGNKYIFEKEVA